MVFVSSDTGGQIMDGNVTMINQEIIWNDDYRTPEEMLEYLNGEHHFGSFFYTLKRLMAEKGLVSEDADRNAVRDKINILAKQEIKNYETKNIRNWIRGGNKPGSKSSRDILFLCFILGLGYDGSVEFLRKGCGRGGFNVHDPYEVLAAYCLANGYRYRDYLELKNRFDNTEQEFGDYDESTMESLKSFQKLTLAGAVSVEELFNDYLQPIAVKYRQQSHYKVEYYHEYRIRVAEDFIHYGNVKHFQKNYYDAWRSIHLHSTNSQLRTELKNDEFNNAGIEKLYNRLLDEIDEGDFPDDAQYTFLINLITPQTIYREMFPSMFNEETSEVKNHSESKLNDVILTNFPDTDKFREVDKADSVNINKTEFRKGFILLHYIDAVMDPVYGSFAEWYDSLNNDLIQMQEMPLYEGDPFDFLIMYSIRRMMDFNSRTQENYRLDDAGADFLTSVLELSFEDDQE